jgi:hypothetical protein
LRLTAIMLNRAENRSYPEFGYRVTYQGVPQSAAERAALRQHLIETMAAGLMDPVSAYQELHPGATDAEALQALQAIQTIRNQIAGFTPAPEPTPAPPPVAAPVPPEVSDGSEV